MQSISSMASLTTTFENLFHCLFFSYNIVSCCYNQALLPAVGLYCFIWHPRLIMPVFSTQHVYICLISIPPVTTLSHSLEQWFCHGAYFTIVRNGANFEKMIDPGAELVGTCPYDLLSLLPTLSYIPRKNSVLPTFWQSKEGLEDTDAKETFFFTPKVAYIMSERALMKPLAYLQILFSKPFIILFALFWTLQFPSLVAGSMPRTECCAPAVASPVLNREEEPPS